MTELIWEDKYKDGKKITPVRIALPFQTIETVNESSQQWQKTQDFFAAEPTADYNNKEWRNRLIWGDQKYVLPSLLPEFAGKVNLIYIYSKNEKHTFNTIYDQYSEDYIKTYYRHKDERGVFLDRDLSAKGLQGVVIKEFEKALHEIVIEHKEPLLLSANRLLSTTPPFPTSKKLLEAKKTVFNYTACGNDFEYDFAKFLEKADDVKAFAKIPDQFGFCVQYTDTLANIRNYFPDFIAVAEDGTKWIVETKGREDIEVKLKDNTAINWCKAATGLKEQWKYVKVPQKEFEQLHPDSFEKLVAGINPPDLV